MTLFIPNMSIPIASDGQIITQKLNFYFALIVSLEDSARLIFRGTEEEKSECENL